MEYQLQLFCLEFFNLLLNPINILCLMVGFLVNVSILSIPIILQPCLDCGSGSRSQLDENLAEVQME
jgi:hypothetical protein